VRDDDLRLADLLAALSVATDLGMGQEPEKAVRGCLVATSLARAMDLPDPEVGDVFYTTLLQHVGCTAPGHELTYLFGDDLTVAPQAERTDSASLRETLALLATVGRGTGVHRARHLARTLAAGRDGSRSVARAVCEVGALMAERLGLGTGVGLGLRHGMERWDGKGDAYGLAGDDIALPARLTAVATQAVIFDRLGGQDAAVEMARRRAGGWFDPTVAERFQRVGPGVLRRLAEVDVWAEVLEAEPGPVARLAGMHHERQDGSGYHHRAAGAEVPTQARLLAAADAYQAMTQDRPHRPALTPEAAARELEAATRAGHFDPECARAVIQAAGQRPSRSRSPWPRGLSDREVEVLRLVARGLSNRQIAATLVISTRTAEHHVQHVYTKIGASTRAAAAMFAMEHGLLR
jgi:DNA-binding CsgD family transcriptional regulator